mgnify:CR=1 FL=1
MPTLLGVQEDQLVPLADMREAFHVAKEDHVILALIASKTTFAIGAGAVSQLAVFASDVFNKGDGGSGLLLAARGAVAAQTGVWLGPCIGPDAFEVGPEVRAAFAEHGGGAAISAFRPGQGDRWLAHLPALARLRLQALGLTNALGNDGSSPWCTVTGAGRFFSHRRDAFRLGSSGRMAACIWRD